jgi:hypothetical protein
MNMGIAIEILFLLRCGNTASMNRGIVIETLFFLRYGTTHGFHE